MLYHLYAIKRSNEKLAEFVLQTFYNRGLKIKIRKKIKIKKNKQTKQPLIVNVGAYSESFYLDILFYASNKHQ